MSEIGTPEDGQAFSTNEIRVLAPLGMLGYGYPLASFQAGLAREPHLIAVDAGSTDAGPHKLGRGVGIVSRAATKHDLTPLVHASAERRIPLVIGSAGGTGQRSRVDWTVEIVREISAEAGLSIRIAVIYADVTAERVKKVFEDGHLTALRGVPELSHDDIQAVTAIVAQMGPEPVMAALEGGADVIICGRAYDPAIFAALPMLRGFDAGLALHMGKILECGAQCATPGAASDCMLGILEYHGFVLEPLNPVRACTPITVSAHTLYEKSDPANLPGPGGVLDLSHCRYEALDERRVTVSGSRFVADAVYRVKLEGAVCDGYRAVCMAGVRDPIMIAQLDECLDYARGVVRERSGADSQVNFLVYGRDAVMGKAEPKRDSPAHEVGLVIETIAADQETADHLCGLARATLMHFHYTGRMATAGNLAFAFAPSDMPAGPVYRFVLYHTMPLETGLDLFPVHWIEAGNAQTIA